MSMLQPILTQIKPSVVRGKGRIRQIHPQPPQPTGFIEYCIYTSRSTKFAKSRICIYTAKLTIAVKNVNFWRLQNRGSCRHGLKARRLRCRSIGHEFDPRCLIFGHGFKSHPLTHTHILCMCKSHTMGGIGLDHSTPPIRHYGAMLPQKPLVDAGTGGIVGCQWGRGGGCGTRADFRGQMVSGFHCRVIPHLDS